MTATSPTVRQRELGKRLRELRNQRNYTVEFVADKLLCSATKISRLETGPVGRASGMSGTCAGSTKLTRQPQLIS